MEPKQLRRWVGYHATIRKADGSFWCGQVTKVTAKYVYVGGLKHYCHSIVAIMRNH